MKTRKMMKVMTAACLAVLMTAFAGCGKKEAATSGQGGKIEYKLAYHLPADHPLAKGVESFIQKVKEKTHGEVTITAYPAGQLYNDKSMNDAIMTGGVDMGLNTVGRWATVVPAMEVFDVPFVFPSYEKIDQAIDGGMGRTLADELAKKHVKVVYWADYGFVQFANNKKPIQKPQDFEGLKIRGYSEIASETIKALGASPVTMGSAEVYMAMQRGTIDGQSSGTSAMRDRKIHEVAKYLTVTNHASPEFILAMNDRSFAKMSKEQQDACIGNGIGDNRNVQDDLDCDVSHDTDHQKGSEQVGGIVGNEHEPVYHEQENQDDGYCPEQPQFLTYDGKNHIVLGLRKETQLLDALPQPLSHQAARSNGIQSLKHLEALVRGV